jgi:putative hemolysin
MAFASAFSSQLVPRATAHSVALRVGSYAARLADTNADRDAVLRLRYEVFNLELNEGLDCSHATGRDADEFDSVCDHLLIEHLETGRVVGTYRLQTGNAAQCGLGYYSEREFDFSPYEALRSRMVELGRACIHRDHRSFDALTTLWKGVAHYATAHGARYLIGCSSLTSQDATLGAAMYRRLAQHEAEPALRTRPTPRYAFSIADIGAHDVSSLRPPKLLRAYLTLGARTCGPPAIDREFKTIDFLTLLDLRQLPAAVGARLLCS